MKRVISCFVVLILTAASFSKAQQPLFYGVGSCNITDKYDIPLRNILSGHDGLLQPVALSEISPWFVLSVLAAEDKRFFEHSGVDTKAAARALWQNVSSGGVVSGASTITQQLVSVSKPKNKNIISKIKEIFDAKDLESKMDKEEILEAYFNTINFGGNIYGAEAAARAYFDTTALSLSLAQAAFLAGIIKAPANYNPRKNFALAQKRQRVVLDRMLKNGFINNELYQNALDEGITVLPSNKPFAAPHYSEYIKKLAPLCEGKIKTTIDGKIQEHIEGLLPGYVERFKVNNLTNAAVVVLENSTGAVLAMAGSADYFDAKNNGYVNGAVSLRQPGSTLKPFVYALALEEGYKASDKIKDEDKFFAGGFRPRNYDEGYHGTPSVREALACSYNIPVIQVAEKLGTAKILEVLKNAGFDSLTKTADDYGLGLALGNGEVTLLELANAYRALANDGVWSPVIFAADPLIIQSGESKNIFTPQSAYIITDILSDNNARAAAFGLNSPLNLPFTFASKTGTSKDYRDNWAVGYNERFTIAVWTGNFNGEPMRRVSGISGAAPLLRDIAMFLEQNYPAKVLSNKTSMIRPEGIEELKLCAVSGKIAGKNCKTTVTEVYASGNKPPEVCALSAKKHQNAAAEEAKEAGITFPQNGDIFMLDPAVPEDSQQLLFKSAEAGIWSVNGRQLSCMHQQCFWPLETGEHELKLKTHNKEYKVYFKVL